MYLLPLALLSANALVFSYVIAAFEAFTSFHLFVFASKLLNV